MCSLTFPWQEYGYKYGRWQRVRALFDLGSERYKWSRTYDTFQLVDRASGQAVGEFLAAGAKLAKYEGTVWFAGDPEIAGVCSPTPDEAAPNWLVFSAFADQRAVDGAIGPVAAWRCDVAAGGPGWSLGGLVGRALGRRPSRQARQGVTSHESSLRSIRVVIRPWTPIGVAVERGAVAALEAVDPRSQLFQFADARCGPGSDSVQDLGQLGSDRAPGGVQVG